jgi:ubiquinol-cytochrome c reductase cytochrome c subunit
VIRRLLVPSGLVVLAVALGLLAFAPGRQQTGSGAATGLASAVLADTTSSSTSAQLALGKMLFDQTCSSCHGPDAQGSALAPNLHRVGAATVDLWVSSGWMPLANPTSEPIRKPPLFNRAQTIAIAEYVASLGSGGPGIPTVDLKNASVSEGFSIFALNCAPCHTVTGAGDALSNGLTAPALHGVTKVQVAEAVRTGPGNMPRFAAGTVSKKQLTDLIAYVTRDIEHSDNPGGLGLGGVGPVAEGFIGLFVGVGACVLIGFWVGDRTQRDADEGHGGDGDGGHDDGDGDGGHDGGDGEHAEEAVEIAHA